MQTPLMLHWSYLQRNVFMQTVFLALNVVGEAQSSQCQSDVIVKKHFHLLMWEQAAHAFEVKHIILDDKSSS